MDITVPAHFVLRSLSVQHITSIVLRAVSDRYLTKLYVGASIWVTADQWQPLWHFAAST